MFTQNLVSVDSQRAENRDSLHVAQFSNWSSNAQITSSRRQAGPSAAVGSSPRRKPFQRYSPQYIFNPMFQSMASNSYGLFIPEPQPRSFDELHTERSYLLNSLQQENFKATELLRKLPPLEETLMVNQISHVRRKARKRIEWLRYRINETTRQEKTILNRLGQLAYEIQSRERWNQIESERRQREQNLNNQSALCQRMEQIQFSPIEPEFQANVYPFPYMQTPQPQKNQAGQYSWQPSTHDHAPEPIPRTYIHESIPTLNENLETAIQAGAVESAVMRGPGLMHRSSSMSNVDVGGMAINTLYVPVPQMKRHSTGGQCLSNFWSDHIDIEQETEKRYESCGEV